MGGEALADATTLHTPEDKLRQRLQEAIGAIEERNAKQAAAGIFAESDIADLQERLDFGIKEIVERPRSTRPVDIILGVDFGTASTKIVARLPYEAGAPAFAVPVPPSACAEDHVHLWASRLWLGGDGVFSLRPIPGAPLLCGIKAALMMDGADREVVLQSGTWGVTALEAAAAFLALQLRQARGWLLTKQHAASSVGMLRWAYHVGFPAASLDDEDLRTRYAAACAAALCLSRRAEAVSVASVRTALGAAATNSEALQKLSIELVPEIAAAVACFATSSRREMGLYAMVDVGAGTVDCCTFNLVERHERGETACPIFMADVSMLGVEPWLMCKDDPELALYFEKRVQRQQWSVIWETKQSRYRRSERWRTSLPVFLVGGGAASEIHRSVTLRLDEWLRRSTGGKGGARLLPLPIPDGLQFDCSAEAVHRLAVAFGLSLSSFDIPKAELPCSIDDDLPTTMPDTSRNYISKDMV